MNLIYEKNIIKNDEHRQSSRMVTDTYNFRILKNPNIYPGTHQLSNERTSQAFKPLEPKSQVLFI